MIFKVPGVEVGTKNRSKIDPKMKTSWGSILASIFHGFWSILKAKLVPCWGRKSLKMRFKKALKNECEKKIVSLFGVGGAVLPSYSPMHVHYLKTQPGWVHVTLSPEAHSHCGTLASHLSSGREVSAHCSPTPAGRTVWNRLQVQRRFRNV